MLTNLDDAGALADFVAKDMIRQTMCRYAHAIDYGENDNWVDCFTEDGVFEMNPVRRPRMLDERVHGTPHPGGMRVSGRAELHKYIARHSSAPEIYHKHHILNSLIELTSETTASGETYWTMMIEDNENRPKVLAFGRYLDAFELEGDGRWRIRVRISEIEAMG